MEIKIWNKNFENKKNEIKKNVCVYVKKVIISIILNHVGCHDEDTNAAILLHSLCFTTLYKIQKVNCMLHIHIFLSIFGFETMQYDGTNLSFNITSKVNIKSFIQNKVCFGFDIQNHCSNLLSSSAHRFSTNKFRVGHPICWIVACC